MRDHLLKGDGTLTYYPTDAMLADPLTKALPAPSFLKRRTSLLDGLRDSEIQGGFVENRTSDHAS